MLLLALFACPSADPIPDPGSDVLDTTTPPPPPLCERTGSATGDPTVDVAPEGPLPHVRVVEVTTPEPASLAIRCTARSDAEDVLLWESAEATTHELRLGGLRADSAYDCLATTICPELPQGPTAFTITTGSLPPSIPASSVTRHATLAPDPAAPHLLVNHTQHCANDPTHRLLVYDLDGHLRWFYDALPPGTPVAIGAQYVGGGRFLWGGGWTREGSVEIVEIDHTPVYKAAFEGSEDRVFHHEGRMLPDGRVLMITQSDNHRGGATWEGFRIWVVDPETDTVSWQWDSQRAVDDGDLPPGEGDVYHANAADIVPTADGDLLVVSLCFSKQVIGVDVATGAMRWDFGAGGTFDLVDTDGNPLPNAEYPDCQHGVELIDDRLLVYDNGRTFRDHSRAAEYRLDLASGTATQTWTWTEPGWWEGALGDIDELSAQRVLITQAHPECWSNVPGDRSASWEVHRPTGEVVWRHTFGHILDTSYRSERFDGCDAFPQARLCPTVANRLAQLSERFTRPDTTP